MKLQEVVMAAGECERQSLCLVVFDAERLKNLKFAVVL